jgi:hypothetical protein
LRQSVKVRGLRIITTPITELESDIIQMDRGYEPDFSCTAIGLV